VAGDSRRAVTGGGTLILMGDVGDGIAAYQTVRVRVPGGAGRGTGRPRDVAGTRGLPAIRVAGGPAFGVAHGRAPSRTGVNGD
jgi:hypothetical protein